MWGAPEEPPDSAEGVPGTSQPVNVREICEDNKSQLETFKDIMLKNKNDLKRKEEELQEYASKLSQIKSRSKLSRRSKDGASSSAEPTIKSRTESTLPEGDVVDDISQAKTPKAKSSLLQRKLAENRKVFERRSKEMTASKRAVEEKVEAIRQQMDQTDMTIAEAHRDSLTVTPVRPVLITQIVSPPVPALGHLQDKDNKIAELSNRILELEATVIDLQDNLKEKDSVIESKTRAVTLMSADLSKKGKTTLDTLEDTKDEMRTMQENFVLIETSLKGKNENLLEQLQERNDKVAELESTVNRYQQEMEEKRLADSASESLSRSTIDTLADTKDAMRSMQENFVLIETSLKDKIDNLLQQLQDRETRLAEAEEKMHKLESGAGIVAAPEIPDLQYKIDRLERSNRALQDEKYELQKSIAELQEKIVARESSNGNGLILEKDNRIAELENLIEELKRSNQLLEEESKAELQKQVVELTTANDEFRSKIDDLEKLNNDLEIRMNELRTKVSDESDATKDDAAVKKLTKELDDLNKSMIKLKAQHKGKLRNLQKQLESFKAVSDANAELVKLGNQVALLEEEKASAGDWQDRVADLESRLSTQTNDIQAHVEAIAILENQKLDLMQELHTAKQEISALEAENAESENLRVTAEMKVVDLEEQLESLHKSRDEPTKTEDDTEREELLNRIEHLTQENRELVQKVAKLDEKPSSDAGSTESFETIHEDRNVMLRKIETLTSRSSELEEKLAKSEEKLSKLEEGARSNVGSTESFETINDTDKSELIKKIDLLSRENSDLVTKLNKLEEKGSSDTGSTESFEKIPEHGESPSRIEILTRENNELVIKLTKIEEKYEALESRLSEAPRDSGNETTEIEQKLENLVRENSDLVIELTKVQEKLSRVSDEREILEKRIEGSQAANATAEQDARDSTAEIEAQDLKSRLESLTTENNELIIKLVKMEEKNSQLSENLQKLAEAQAEKLSETAVSTAVTVASLESEIAECRKLIAEQTELVEEMKMKLSEKEAELDAKIHQISEHEAAGISVEELQRELKESFGVIEEWRLKCADMERKMEILEAGKISIVEGLEILQTENKVLVEQSRQKDQAAEALKQELDDTIATFEVRLEEQRAFIAKQEEEIKSLREIVKTKDEELHEKYLAMQNEMINIDTLQDELNVCRNRLQHNETTIASLNEEIARLNSLVDSGEEQTLAARAEIIVLREELKSKAAKEAKNEELSRLLSDKDNLAVEMKTILNEQLRENAELRNVVESTNAEVARLRVSLAEREKELGALEAAESVLKDKERELASIEAARSALEIDLQNLAAENAKIENDFHQVQSTLDHRTRSNEDLQTEVAQLKTLLNDVTAKYTEDAEAQQRKLETIVADLNAKNAECATLRTELEAKSALCETLSAELAERLKSVADLESRSLQLEIIRGELAEKEKMIGQNVTAEAKIALELRVEELERRLEESEANTQTQLKKRKILAANLKKKSSEVAEHETRAAQFEAKLAELEHKAAEHETRATELGEKLIATKSEKDAANLRVQEIQSVVEDRDRAILQLEEQLQRVQREAAIAGERVDELSSELYNSTEKINAVMDQMTEMGEEIEKLRRDIELKASEIELERNEKANIIADYNSCRRIVDEVERLRAEIELKTAEIETERTEKARIIADYDSCRQIVDEVEKLRAEIALKTSEIETERIEKARIIADYDSCRQIVDEVEKLRAEITLKSSELEAQRSENARIIAEYNSCRQKIVDEEIQRQQVLDEAKEKARELGVRMQVMETEYVDQLNAIQTLRTENGMLVSKQAQILEKLENAEKEAAERKILLDQLQREPATRELANVHRVEPPNPEDDQTDPEGKSSQPCDHCDQCQTVVQALEAKLQERDAEIENLDNELANSIGNFVHMRESLRVSDLMNQSGSRNRGLEDARGDSGDLVVQLNALTAGNADIREQLNATIRENQELKDKIASLQALNGALQERTGAVEEELVEGREAATRFEAVEALRAELTEKCELGERELRATRSELEAARQRHEESMTGLRSRVEQLEMENRLLTDKCDAFVRTNDIAVGEVSQLRGEIERCERRAAELEAEIEKHRRENKKLEETARPAETNVASASAFFERDDGPQLFDAAKVFGLSASADSNGQREIADLRGVLAIRDAENKRLAEEARRLGERLDDERANTERTEAECRRLNVEMTQLEQLLAERNRQIDALNSELNNVGAQLAGQFDQQGNTERLESLITKLRAEIEEQSNRLNERDIVVEQLKSANAEITAQLENLQHENIQYSSTIDVVSSAVRNIEEAENITESPVEPVSPVRRKLATILESLIALRQERSDLMALQETLSRRISALESDAESSGDASRIQELEERVDRITRERDIKQLQVNDLARSLEEMQESVEKASSHEESRLRNLQAALDEALSEHERLKVQLQTTRRETSDATIEPAKTIEATESAQTSKIPETRESNVPDAESGWDDEAKFDADEEIWSWHPDDAELAAGHELLASAALQPSPEIALKTRIAELEDTIGDLEAERDRLAEEVRVAQTRSAKLVKKLKEFKIQNEGLQQQLKIQKASCGFGDLDSAIEEELKSQIAALEKTLAEAKDEHRKTCAERDNLAKRIDVLAAANERLVEMKERQDMEVEVLQIRTKDLANKLQAVEWQFRETCGDETQIASLGVGEAQIEARQAENLQGAASRVQDSSASTSTGFECLCRKYKEEIDELRDEMEALAAENEQLQKLLEEQKATRQSSESRHSEQLALRDKEAENSARLRSELEKNLEDARREHANLKNSWTLSTRNSDEQTAAIRQSHERLKIEIAEKTNDFETQMAKMRREIEAASSQIDLLQERLEIVAREKQELAERTKSHEETKEKLVSLTDTTAELTDLLNARVQEVAELKREIQRLKSDRNEALDTVEGLAINHTREMTETQREAREYLQQCETQLTEKSNEIRSLRERLADAEEKLAAGAEQLNEMLQRNRELQENLAVADRDRDTNAVRVDNLREEIERLNSALTESRLHRESLQSELAGKEQQAYRDEDEVRKYSEEVERLNEVVAHTQKTAADAIDEANRKIREIEDREASLRTTIAELTARESDALAEMYREISEKDGKVATLQRTITSLEQKIHEVTSGAAKETVEGLPVCRMIGEESEDPRTTVEQLQTELRRKNEEIEDYRYQLSESTYPSIIQALQDQVNKLYEEKAQVEEALNTLMENLHDEQPQKELEAEFLRRDNERQLDLQRQAAMQSEIEALRRQVSGSRSEETFVTMLSAKDTEIRNLKVEIEEKGVRFRELHDHYESAMVEINELRIHLASKEEELRMVRMELEAMSKERELLQRALGKESTSDSEATRTSEASNASSTETIKEQSSNELDLALYMLHQRDVRVEELTHELMQLLEERDTLQLRLSNAIRINEELRRSVPAEIVAGENIPSVGDVEPLVEQPSPSKSVGPVEIAKEAIDSPAEEKVALAQKLSQLHNMGHRRDVRLMDDRELRHNQQMSLLAHRDVLSSLPPEAAARLVNANYTLSRDVQSQSSVLMNWLWGKSTPKVVHM